MSGSNDSGIVPNLNEHSTDVLIGNDCQNVHSRFVSIDEGKVNSSHPHNVLSGCITSINVENMSAQKFRIQDGISRLKIEKLDLLRHILSVQHDIRRLKDRESQLRDDLTAASREIEYLKAQSAFLQYSDQHQQEQLNGQNNPISSSINNSSTTFHPKETKSFRTTSFKVITKDR